VKSTKFAVCGLQVRGSQSGVQVLARLMSRMPSRPSNGARTVLRSICACKAAALAVADCIALSALSSCALARRCLEPCTRPFGGDARQSELGVQRDQLRIVQSSVCGRPGSAVELDSPRGTMRSWSLCTPSSTLARVSAERARALFKDNAVQKRSSTVRERDAIRDRQRMQPCRRRSIARPCAPRSTGGWASDSSTWAQYLNPGTGSRNLQSTDANFVDFTLRSSQLKQIAWALVVANQ